MRNHICRSCLALFTLLFLCEAYAADITIQKVSEEPLAGGTSFNTITFADRSVTGWVTAPSVEMRGRHGLLISNMSTTDSIYLTDVTGSTVTGTLRALERAYFNASSGNHIYISANTVVTVQVWEIR